METYKCHPGVMRRCEIHAVDGCDGTYKGDDCQCAADNQTYMPPTEREELQAYRALCTVEELSALAKARNGGRAVVLPCKVGEWLYYLLDDKVRKAKVEEIQCSAYKHNPQFKVTVFAWDFSAKEQLTYCPAGDSWIGNNRGFVRVFLTPAEAEAALGGGGDG